MEHKDLEFEKELTKALRHRAAPVGMKQRVLAMARERRQKRHGWRWTMQRAAASVVLAAAAGGLFAYRQVEERRRGEEAREQVMTALRITNRTLDRVSERLADDNK